MPSPNPFHELLEDFKEGGKLEKWGGEWDRKRPFHRPCVVELVAQKCAELETRSISRVLHCMYLSAIGGNDETALPRKRQVMTKEILRFTTNMERSSAHIRYFLKLSSDIWEIGGGVTKNKKS